MNFQQIETQVASCQKCSLWKTRTKPVVFRGKPTSKLVFIGEAPGRDEDLSGIPFVGKAGKIFDDLRNMAGIGGNFIVINTLKCRPPHNAEPTLQQLDMCWEWMEYQLACIQPKLIVLMGKSAVKMFFPAMGHKSIEDLRNMNLKHPNYVAEFFVTYHPGAAIYDQGLTKIMAKDYRKINERFKSIQIGVTV